MARLDESHISCRFLNYRPWICLRYTQVVGFINAWSTFPMSAFYMTLLYDSLSAFCLNRSRLRSSTLSCELKKRSVLRVWRRVSFINETIEQALRASCYQKAKGSWSIRNKLDLFAQTTLTSFVLLWNTVRLFWHLDSSPIHFVWCVDHLFSAQLSFYITKMDHLMRNLASSLRVYAPREFSKNIYLFCQLHVVRLLSKFHRSSHFLSEFGSQLKRNWKHRSFRLQFSYIVFQKSVVPFLSVCFVFLYAFLQKEINTEENPFLLFSVSKPCSCTNITGRVPCGCAGLSF